MMAGFAVMPFTLGVPQAKSIDGFLPNLQDIFMAKVSRVVFILAYTVPCKRKIGTFYAVFKPLDRFSGYVNYMYNTFIPPPQYL